MKLKRSDSELLKKYSRVLDEFQVIASMPTEGVSKQDSNEGIFFARELESIEQKLYEFKLRELLYRKHIPVSNRDNPGAEEVTYYMFGKVGMAKVIANYGDDSPRADVYGQMFKQKVRSLGASYGYTTQEMRAARMVGRSLEEMKAVAARRSIHEKENKVAWNGDADYNLQGFLTNSNIPTAEVLAGVGGKPWSVKTADEIIKDIMTGVNAVKLQSKNIHQANTLLLPLGEMTRIGALHLPNTNVSVLKYIRENAEIFGLTTIDQLAVELDTAGTGGTKLAIYYEKDPEVLELRIPLEMMALPVQYRNYEFVINIESRIGGVVVRYPLGIYFQYGL